MPKIVIASVLTSGFVGFLAPDGTWTDAIDAAEVADDEASEAALLARAEADAANNIVIDPYLIEIEVVDGERRPTVYREYIRAMGPSVPIPGTAG